MRVISPPHPVNLPPDAVRKKLHFQFSIPIPVTHDPFRSIPAESLHRYCKGRPERGTGAVRIHFIYRYHGWQTDRLDWHIYVQPLELAFRYPDHYFGGIPAIPFQHRYHTGYH